MAPRWLLPAVLLITIVSGSCESPTIELYDEGTDDPQDVPTRVLEVHVSMDAEASELASALGWETGIPGVEVKIQPLGTREWITAGTDAAGVVRFEDVHSGGYRLAASRVLEAGEAADAGVEVSAFGGGKVVRVASAADREESLILRADEGEGLMFSELGLMNPFPWEISGAVTGGAFIEIYNGSNQTVFLDGWILGVSYPHWRDSARSCEATEPLRLPPEGLHARLFQAFPGTGGDHPLQPGDVVVIAYGAADHRPVHPGFPDLSGADFEILAEGGTDNPGVPNMEDIGLEWWPRFALFASQPFFLARPVDPDALPTLEDPSDGRTYVRFPDWSIVDVVGMAAPLASEPDTRHCGNMLRPELNSLEFPSPTWGHGKPEATIQRKGLRTAPDGRVILQNTRTAAVDFVMDYRNLGAVRRP